ncbi:hypothetical protein H9P43_004707 [Blastocladiella emersonii ATCC 22665]|nr:hypothetical protein H9P43_004707 [Blastocladiella emersonii ATCC 22665]
MAKSGMDSSRWQHDLFTETTSPDRSSLSLDDRLGGRGGRSSRNRDRGDRRDRDDARPSFSTAQLRRSADDNVGDSYRIVVEGLHFEVTEADLKELMDPYRATKVALRYDSTDRSTGVADIEFASRSDADAACDRYHGMLLDNKQMTLRDWHPRYDGRGFGSTARMYNRSGTREWDRDRDREWDRAPKDGYRTSDLRRSGDSSSRRDRDRPDARTTIRESALDSRLGGPATRAPRNPAPAPEPEPESDLELAPVHAHEVIDTTAPDLEDGEYRVLRRPPAEIITKETQLNSRLGTSAAAPPPKRFVDEDEAANWGRPDRRQRNRNEHDNRWEGRGRGGRNDTADLDRDLEEYMKAAAAEPAPAAPAPPMVVAQPDEDAMEL